jgi:hypothetical protein
MSGAPHLIAFNPSGSTLSQGSRDVVPTLGRLDLDPHQILPTASKTSITAPLAEIHWDRGRCRGRRVRRGVVREAVVRMVCRSEAVRLWVARTRGEGQVGLRRIQGPKVTSSEMRLLGTMAPSPVMIPSRSPRWALDSSGLDPHVPTSDTGHNRTGGGQDDQGDERQPSVS